MIKYAVITDEISQDINIAASLAKKYNLEGLEIRSVNDRGPHQLTDADISEIKEAMEKNSLECCAISAPLFKCNLNEKEIAEQMEILEKIISLAKKLGTKCIRGFTFFKEEDFEIALPKIAAEYQKIIPILEKEDMYVYIESDPSVNASCGETLAKVIEAVGSDRVGGLWDPGNDVYSPENEKPYPDGYSFMKKFVRHVHIKDAVRNGDNADGVAFGDGEVDFEGQLTALRDDGYDGYIVMETHYRPKSIISDELLLRPQGSDFSSGGYEATDECLEKFCKLANKIFSK